MSRPITLRRIPIEARRNRGAAILILITIILLATTTLLVSEISVNKTVSSRFTNNSLTLSDAKEALLGYALAQATPGSLPCPDSTGNGLENTNGTGCQTQLGLLPTRTLNLPLLTDSAGASLWYAVSLNIVTNATAQKNSSSPANLSLDGQPAVAIIIAPGHAINGQSRRQLVVADYLEGNNADGNTTDYESTITATSNDQLLSIEPHNFWSLIEKRVLAEASRLFRSYRAACGEFPFAADFGGPYNSVTNQQAGAPPFNSALPTAWGAACGANVAPTPASWLSNQWSDQLYYAMCRTIEGNCLTLIGGVPSAAKSVILAPGIPLNLQTRPAADPTDYFEDENSSLPATQYRQRTVINHSSSYNDSSTSL
jgi:hypothetical protein